MRLLNTRGKRDPTKQGKPTSHHDCIVSEVAAVRMDPSKHPYHWTLKA